MDAKQQYLNELESTLNIQRDLLNRLENRVLMLQNASVESEFQSNENQILIIKTNAEIGSLKLIINEKHNYFVKYAELEGKKYGEIDEKFDAVLKIAKEKAKTNDSLKHIIQNVNIEKIKTNQESKMYLYNKMLSLIND
jgi:hypothetical protein